MYDTSSSSGLPVIAPAQVTTQLSTALTLLPPGGGEVALPADRLATDRPTAPASRRGRPIQLPEAQLWLGLLWAVLEGLAGYRALTRYLATHTLGRFAPVSLTDSAVLQR